MMMAGRYIIKKKARHWENKPNSITHTENMYVYKKVLVGRESKQDSEGVDQQGKAPNFLCPLYPSKVEGDKSVKMDVGEVDGANKEKVLRPTPYGIQKTRQPGIKVTAPNEAQRKLIAIGLAKGKQTRKEMEQQGSLGKRAPEKMGGINKFRRVSEGREDVSIEKGSSDLKPVFLKKKMGMEEKGVGVGYGAKSMDTMPKKTPMGKQETMGRTRWDIKMSMIKKIQKWNESFRQNPQMEDEIDVTCLFDREERKCWQGIMNEDPKWEGTPEF